MASPHIDIAIIVNGHPAVVSANPHSPLRTVIPKALAETGNDVGQPVENWDLRDAGGTLLDTSQKIETFGFAAGVRLFLSLKAGVGGA